MDSLPTRPVVGAFTATATAQMLAFGAGFIALYLAAFKKLNRDNQAVRP